MRIVLVILIALVFLQTHAQESLTIEKAIATALANNYNIKIARNNQSIADNNFTRGNAGFLPTLSANFDRTYSVVSFEQVRATRDTAFTVSDEGVQTQRQTYGVNLDWTIFDGLRMFKTYDQLEALNLQSRESLRNEIEMLIFNVNLTFYQAALEKERLQLSETNIALSEERVRIAKEKYDLGQASKLEYLQAQVDLNADKTAKIRQQEALDIRKLELMQLLAITRDSINISLKYDLNND
ncbi:MAG: TolC family protein, partial [Fulvivirga sp.]|nr:TolC family protein [Fulvivirga sp.]